MIPFLGMRLRRVCIGKSASGHHRERAWRYDGLCEVRIVAMLTCSIPQMVSPRHSCIVRRRHYQIRTVLVDRDRSLFAASNFHAACLYRCANRHHHNTVTIGRSRDMSGRSRRLATANSLTQACVSLGDDFFHISRLVCWQAATSSTALRQRGRLLVSIRLFLVVCTLLATSGLGSSFGDRLLRRESPAPAQHSPSPPA